MEINEVKTKELTKELLETLLGKDIPFNLYGITENYLFLIKDDSMAVYDVLNKRYVIYYTKGMLKPFKLKNKEEKIITHATSNDITKVKYGYKQYANHKYDLSCDHEQKLIIGDMPYKRFDFDGNEIPFGKCYIDQDYFGNNNIKYHYNIRNDSYYSIKETELEDDPDFDFIYPDDIINSFKMNEKYSTVHTPLKTCDKWDAQSEYIYGLSIIYKRTDNNEFYGVVDSKYNVVLDYDESIEKIKIESPRIILVENKDKQSNLYDIENGYITNFKYRFDSVVRLGNNIFKVKNNNKFRYILNGEISDCEYENIAYDRGVIILTNEDEITFINQDNQVLYKMKKQKYFKSTEDIYYEKNSSIIKHNLYTGEETTIGRRNIVGNGNPIDSESVDDILEKYKYYFIDEDGYVHLTDTMYYGVELESNGISVYRWYDNPDNVKSLQKNLLENLIDMGEKETIHDGKKVFMKNNY